MATAVLRSHDCLKHSSLHQDFYAYRAPPPPMNRKKPSRSPPTKPNQPRTVRQRPTPVRSGRANGSPKKENNNVESPKKSHHLVMGQVTLLKRGEELKPPSPPAVAPSEIEAIVVEDDDSFVLCSTNRLGPDPEILPKLVDLKAVCAVDEKYAGPAYVTSPAPSSLPFPAFFLKKSTDEASVMATKGLRFLLRLD